MPEVAANPSTLEVVRLAYDAFARRDVGTILRLVADDVAWGQPDNPHIPSAGTRHGPTGVLEWLRIGNETEDILLFEPRRFLNDGEGEVAVVGRMRIRVKATGREYESDFVHLITVRDGRILRFQEVYDTFVAAEAFRA